MPCVRVMGSPDEECPWDHVTYKNSSVGYLAARHLLAHGHKNLACLVLDRDGFMGARGNAFSKTATAGGARVEVLDGTGMVVPTSDGQTVEKAKLTRLMDKMLALKPRPTVLFITADIAAPPVYLQLLQRGLRPGKDVEIVSCNNERSLLNSLDPRPAVVDIHAREVGRRAVERLLWRMKNPKAPPADILIHPALVEASSD